MVCYSTKTFIILKSVVSGKATSRRLKPDYPQLKNKSPQGLHPNFYSRDTTDFYLVSDLRNVTRMVD